MRTAKCSECGMSVVVSGDQCVVEVDERAADEMRALLEGGVESLACTACGKAMDCEPTVVVWTDRATRIDLFEGGPWFDGQRATDVWPQLSDVAMTTHDSLTSLRSAIDKRCLGWLELLVEAVQQQGREGSHIWFDEHYESLGPEIYVAAFLAQNDVLSGDVEFECGEDGASLPLLDELVGWVQCSACLTMCDQWANQAFDGQRFQDRIDEIVFMGAVAETAPARFARAMDAIWREDLPMPLAVALEVTHSCLCVCARTANPRAEAYTRAMFDLEIFATEAGGKLPLLAHALRLDPKRLASTVDRDALEAAVHSHEGASRAGLVETARRMGYPEVAKSLVSHPVPDVLKALRTPGTLGTAFMIGPDQDKPIAVLEFTTKDRELQITNVLAESRAERDNEAHPDVFISYSSRDRVKADVLCAYLRRLGLTVFMDHHTAAGDLWTRQIPSALWSSGLVLVLWSRDSLRSQWVLREAEAALERNVLMQALLAPIEIPQPFADIQAARLEAWSNEAGHKELDRLADAIYDKLGRERPQVAPGVIEDAGRQFERAEIAEAVFDLCSANAWHTIAPATEESLAGVGSAYKRLSAALAPATDEVVHRLLERFNLARVLLLAAIAGIDRERLTTGISLPPPFEVTYKAGGTVVDCTQAWVSRAPFVEALRALTEGTTGGSERLAASGSDVVAMFGNLSVEVSKHPNDTQLIGRVTIRVV
jgi:hypothetical protein